jgi:hypothetical protein
VGPEEAGLGRQQRRRCGRRVPAVAAGGGKRVREERMVQDFGRRRGETTRGWWGSCTGLGEERKNDAIGADDARQVAADGEGRRTVDGGRHGEGRS